MLILHVDDNASDRARFGEVIRKIDVSAHVLEATDALDAIRLLSGGNQAQKIDCIFLHINLPLMNGLKMLKVIKGDPELNRIPVFVYAKTGNPKAIEFVKNLGGFFLQKPTDFTALIGSLEAILYCFSRNPKNTNDYLLRHWNSFTCSFPVTNVINQKL